MKMLMISDLHINDCTESYLKKVYHRIDRMMEVIIRQIDPAELLIVVMCGDVVDCGKKEYFESAQKIFNYIKDNIKDKVQKERIEFVMVPGNHDMCDDSFFAFDEFNKKYCKDVIGIFEKDSCYVKNIENFNFILSNSTYHKDYNYGKIDFDAIEKSANPLLDNILVTHHSTVSEDDNDTASIRNGSRLISVINRNNIKYHFHGHTHGTLWTRIGNEGYSLGVGAMFFKAGEMGSQFNLITIERNRIVKIVNYIYLIDCDKYISDLIYEEKDININKEVFIQEKYILKIKCPENYISRKVGPFDIVQKGGISSVYNMEQIKSLYDWLFEKERIVLIGEAGSGKSYELRNLAYMIAQSKKAYPVFIKLNAYVNETIEELISIEMGDDHKIPTVLILDGFDEIEEQNLNSFARRINTFVKKNPKQKIVISTRNNFYRNALEETKAGTFYDFYECSLCPLNNTDIDAYLESNKIESTLFLNEVKNKNLKEQVYSPFYLAQLSKLFKNTGNLQEIDQLMGELIADSFEQDKNKYVNTRDIEGCKREVIKSLEFLAFAMQCMRKTSLPSEEYQELISRSEREIIKYCGVLKQTKEGQCEFEHNNFREHLAAEYIKDIPLDKVIDLVTYKENRNRIKASWMNVLSFAIMIYPQQELFDWIIKTEPSIVVKFESSRLSQDMKTNIFCGIMEKYKNDNVWISRDRNSEEDLAKFGQTEKSILYLLEEIQNPCHFRSQSNAIHIIGQMTDYFGKTKQVRSVLLDCCFNESTRSYEISAAITALTNHAPYDKEDAQKLLDFFDGNYDADIRRALYYYILENGLQDNAIDFVLDGMKALNYYDTMTYGMRRGTEDILDSLKKYESIKKVLDFLLVKADCHSTMELFKNLLEGLFLKAETFFKEGKQDILLCIQKIFWKASINYETDIMQNARVFLLNTEQIFPTYEWILQQPYNNYSECILKNIMDKKCIDDFAEKYKNNLLQNREMFISFVGRSRKDSYRNGEFVKLVLQMDAVVAIGVEQQCNGYIEKFWIGTGFLVSMQEPNNIQTSTIYLITNKHVLNGKNTVYIRFNSISGSFVKDYEIHLIDGCGRKTYTEHPDADVDIIAIQLNPQCLINDSSIWGAINIETESLDIYTMKMQGIDEGWLVYALGFPMNLVSDFKAPICRMGCISRLTDAFVQPEKAKYFLVDAQAFPGNSGGPIISKPDNIFTTIGVNYMPAKLLGVLSAYIPYRDVLISQQTQETKMVQTENSGLTIVYPVDRIKEVVLLDWNRHREGVINTFGTYIAENTEKGQISNSN